MGNICCPSESPCGSAEERSGLLKDDSKVTACAGDTVAAGTCGPEGGDDIRKTPEEEAKVVPVKPSPENGVTELSNTQENGPLQTESIQTATPSPLKASELIENGTRAQDMKETPAEADSQQAELLPCTLNSPAEEKAAAELEVCEASNAEVKEGSTSSVEDRIPDDILPTVETACAETPPQSETNTTLEHITTSLTTDDDETKKEEHFEATVEDAAGGLSEELLPNDDVTLMPNTSLSEPESIIAIDQEKQPLSSVAAEDSDNSGSSSVCREEPHPEDAKSHEVCSTGSAPAGLASSGENQDSSSSIREPETTAPADARESLKSDQDAKTDPEDPECAATSSNEASGEEVMPKVQDKVENVPKVEGDDGTAQQEETEATVTEAESQAGKDAEIQETVEHIEQLAAGEALELQAVVTPPSKKEKILGNSEEDLYRGAEELSASHSDEPGQPPGSEGKLLKVEDRCSLSPAMDILLYSEREWRGNTAKSTLIKKGYKEMSQRFSCVRRVRGDNYCALRATLFQVLSHSTHLPAWLQEDGITMLLQQLEAQEGLISQWTFPGECLQGDGTGDATQQLKGYMELLQNKWRAAVGCASAWERQQLCDGVFQGGEEELGLLEALKLLMLGRAVELHGCMQAGHDVPLFCWLLFARDSSDCPRSFLSNHLSHVGLSAGLEQVEMFLLGYALQCTIQVYRLYKADTEEFFTYYPDDHKDDWPSVCLVTEDDRHYNVPIVEAANQQEVLASS